MTSYQYNQLAAGFLWSKNYPADMHGLAVRLIDFTGESSFQHLTGGRGIDTLTDWRAVQDRVAIAIRRRGGQVQRVRANINDYHAWRVRHRFKDTTRIRDLFLANGELVQGLTLPAGRPSPRG